MKPFAAVLFFLLATASNAGAFVPHDYPEIYIHQMGHVYFALSCVFTVWAIVHNRLHEDRGWRYLLYAEAVFILWNVDTFAGHITEFWIEPSQISGAGAGWGYFTRTITVEGRDYLYYITKYDNLLLVLAMLLFYLGLREHVRKERRGEIVPASAAAVLPLMPVMLVDVSGAIVVLALSIMSILAAVELYRKNKESTLWNYMLWLSTSYVLFSVSRSLGHILNRILSATGHQDVWKLIEPVSGSFNSFTFIMIGSMNLFFFRAYRSYLRITEDSRKIEAINADLTELNQELETLVAERTMSMMALTVADRVRNPAAVIGWTCKRILEREPVSDRMGENLKDVIDESEKLEAIVRDFETLLKSKQSMFKYEDINEVMRGVLPLVEKEAAEKRIRLAEGLSDRPLRINTQRNLLRAAVFHIIRNAIEATPEGGEIRVATYDEADRVVIVVSDTGAGIPQENLEKIFDPFFTTKKFRFGIGLPLVKQIVSEHMGEISVQSETGKGTTFRLTFPARWMERK